ncbi:MAG: cohesin domain-containing protein, partial [Bacteroidota bacterium]
MKNYLNILILFLASTSLVNAQSINLELPRITAAPGDTVTIPIQVSNLSSAVAFQLRFSYQANSLRFVGYDSVGTTLQGRTFGVNDDSTSTRISYFAFIPLSQSNGVLLKLKYVFLGSPSSLVWNAIQTEFTIGTTATKPTLTHGTIGHSSSGVTISSVPFSSTYCEADTATASVSGTGAGTYQWQISTDTLGGSFVNINGAASNNLSIPAIDRANYNGKFIQVLVSGTGANSTFRLVTPPVKIYVNENIPVQVSVIANPATAICQGTSVTYTASSSSNINDLVYTWKINGIVVGTGPSISRNNLNNGDQITCIASSASTCVSTSSNSSNSVTASVNALPV